jgi:hypothetical protein
MVSRQKLVIGVGVTLMMTTAAMTTVYLPYMRPDSDSLREQRQKQMEAAVANKQAGSRGSVWHNLERK